MYIKREIELSLKKKNYNEIEKLLHHENEYFLDLLLHQKIIFFEQKLNLIEFEYE